MAERSWRAAVIRQARATGAGDLSRHPVDELAAHLEEIYLDARRNGCSQAEAEQAALAVLAEAPLQVVLVNETFARRVFAGANAIGGRVASIANQIGPLGRNLLGRGPFRIVGVDLQQGPLGRPSEPVIYHSSRQFPFRAMTVVSRGADTATVVAGLGSALHSLDRSLPLGAVQTMNERMAIAAAGPRLLTGVLVTFAMLTAALAAIGVYGLLAWTVTERRRELAIRLALGAHPFALARLVTAQGLALTITGTVLGIAGAQAARGLLRHVLFETRSTDAVALASAAAVLVVAAGLACFGPALRATRVAGHMMAVEHENEHARGRERFVAGDILRNLHRAWRQHCSPGGQRDPLECHHGLRHAVLEDGNFVAGQIGHRLAVPIPGEHRHLDDIDAGPEARRRVLPGLARRRGTARRHNAGDEEGATAVRRVSPCGY